MLTALWGEHEFDSEKNTETIKVHVIRIYVLYHYNIMYNMILFVIVVLF